MAYEIVGSYVFFENMMKKVGVIRFNFAQFSVELKTLDIHSVSRIFYDYSSGISNQPKWLLNQIVHNYHFYFTLSTYLASICAIFCQNTTFRKKVVLSHNPRTHGASELGSETSPSLNLISISNL